MKIICILYAAPLKGGTKLVKEIDRGSTENIDKVLVCITAQSNSKRLINKGASVADRVNGELHILHVQKGNNILNNNEAPRLLQQLFEYGTEKGGMVHAYCDDNIPESIAAFIAKEKITKLILGEPPKAIKQDKKHTENQFNKIMHQMSNAVEIIIVGREEDKDYNIELNKRYNVV